MANQTGQKIDHRARHAGHLDQHAEEDEQRHREQDKVGHALVDAPDDGGHRNQRGDRQIAVGRQAEGEGDRHAGEHAQRDDADEQRPGAAAARCGALYGPRLNDRLRVCYGAVLRRPRRGRPGATAEGLLAVADHGGGLDGDAGRRGDRTQIDDALVGHVTVGPGVQNGEVRIETSSGLLSALLIDIRDNNGGAFF